MEFKVNSKELEKLLTKIIPAVPTRTPMSILENFLFEIKDGFLTIIATDLEISMKSSINIIADQDISIVVPAKLTHEVIRSLGDTTVNFIISENKKINLKTDNGEYLISYQNSEDYPEIPTFPTEEDDIKEVLINGSDLKNAFDITSFAMSKEEMRPAMMGTLLEFEEEGLRFVATDGHRLANLIKHTIKPEIEILEKYVIPEKAISVLQKILDEKEVKVYMSNTHISFKLNDIELITRLIGQKYPEYRSVIPLENEFELKVKTKELLSAIKRMMLFSTTSSTRRVKFSISENSLEISAEDVDMGNFGKEKIACTYDGTPIEIGFNSQYVNDVLSHLVAEEEIIFKLHSANKAVIIVPSVKSDKQNLMMLIMPVRLNN
ncbi:MAG: DNA polymerase III subunit beta [Ignavibacteriales bacterium CG18_big_fil_WC_8_21_14_2_50_31_20]|nr:MAG: DNA polymerase III subunit beta [Ignavibacteriales bacterium CG18_big_fil_WC_8_21_14_2_50_31_20]